MAPYIEREFGKVELVALGGSESVGPIAFMLSDTDVYDAEEGENLSEETPLRAGHKLVAAEEAFCSECARRALTPVVLRCANVVGTNMTGWPRQVAESIWDGKFFHFGNNNARISTVHASMVATVVRKLAETLEPDGKPLILNVTDGNDPSVHDFAEALVLRMNNKRISTLSTWGQIWIGKLMCGGKRYKKLTTTLTFSRARLCALIDPQNLPLVEYMRTHVYDQSSL